MVNEEKGLRKKNVFKKGTYNTGGGGAIYVALLVQGSKFSI
jgi:hypothetical protein